MPNGLKNWTFKQTEKVLLEHFFKLVNVEGSHHFYRGSVDGEGRLVTVPFHAGNSILPKTFESIVHKSGIPKEVWRSWSKGNKIAYKGACKWN
jgi:predicted RNA binding protein YcfA (HicA-like mRNA interferase family)